MIRLNKAIAAIVVVLIALACEQGDDNAYVRLDDSPVFRDLPVAASGRQTLTHYAVQSAEYLTSAESGRVGRTVFFRNVGNKQLTEDFIPGLSLDSTDAISYYIDENRPSADLDVASSSEAIARAMRTWDNVRCSDLGIFRVPSQRSIETGFVSALFGFGGSFDYVADVVHAGWLPAAFFDLIAEDGGAYILAVTFTIIFTDDNGAPTDLDNNGKDDVAWREIYYNDAFSWADGAHYDVETVALHETGHGLSQGHFGTAFADAGGGKIHFSPRAVMNAAYSGIQTTIHATDNGGHCSNWSDWPEN